MLMLYDLGRVRFILELPTTELTPFVLDSLATSIGAAVVFFPRLVELTNKKVLAATMAFSGGVMIYISLVDIYNKAIDGFAEQGHEDGDCFIYATLCFFAGMLGMFFVNRVIIDKLLMGGSKMEVAEQEALEMGREKAAEQRAVYDKEIDVDSMDVEAKVPAPECTDTTVDIMPKKVSENLTDRTCDDSVSEDLFESSKLLRTGIATAVVRQLTRL